MIDSALQSRLSPVARRQRWFRIGWELACCWTVAALLGLAISALSPAGSPAFRFAWLAVALPAVAAAVFLALRRARSRPDWRALARRIESRHPDLQGRLLTAVQQHAGPDGTLHYLQSRLVAETLRHSRQHRWGDAVPTSRLALSAGIQALAFLLFAVTLLGLRTGDGRSLLARTIGLGSGVLVTPGDARVERGDSLVVLARFHGAAPAQVELIMETESGAVRRLPMVRNLADALFGGSVPEVAEGFRYHLDYGSQRTRDFRVTVFEHPRLDRADLDLRFPEYTGRAAQRTEDTRRLSAVEGSRLDLRLTLNKPVASARLVARDAETNSLALELEPGKPLAALRDFRLEASRTYELRLVDADGLTNKVASSFVFEVAKNRTPELRLTSPRGDLRPSPLEEVTFEGTVWDDFGVPAYGLGYVKAGEEPVWLELGQAVPAEEKRPFRHLLRLEDLGVEPDEFISWFAWAEDLGPDGRVRRTPGDLFFAEIRPFDEIFREGQGMEAQSGQGQAGGESGQEGSPASRLAELQKQILSATWRLQREHGVVRPPAGPAGTNSGRRTEPRVKGRFMGSLDLHSLDAPRDHEPGEAGGARRPHRAGGALGTGHSTFRFMGSPVFGAAAPERGTAPPSSARPTSDRSRGAARPGSAKPPSYAEDVAVVRDSQAQALEQAEEAAGQEEDTRAALLWASALDAMEKALDKLSHAAGSPASLAEAVAEEQKVYQALLRLQEHEYQVSRSRRQSGGGGGRNQQMQRQLEQMDLTQAENRYETLRQAQAPPTAQRTEELQVMNRLQELARRQQDLNERLQELQSALQQARDEEERAELRRRLQRLEEEERQMLADLDEVRQRMDRQENQSSMADERRQLDQIREDMQQAADAAAQGAASQALASGSRAQRQLQQVRDQMRQESSSQFADELREMRSDARELARQQEELTRQMEAEAGRERRSLSTSPERQAVADQLTRQTARLTNLVDRATEVSQLAESSEALLSRQLYDTLRKFSQDSNRALQEAREELVNGGLVTRSLYDRLQDKSGPEGARLMELTTELLRQDLLPQASASSRRAQAGLDELRRGVERAAESVLGDDAQALRLAQQELDRLTEQLGQEMTRAAEDAVRTNRTGQGAQAEPAPGQADRARERGDSSAGAAEPQNGASPSTEPGPDSTPPGAEASQTAQTAGEGAARTPEDGVPTASNPGARGDGEPRAEGGQGGQRPEGGNRRRTLDGGSRVGATSGGGGDGGDLSGSLARDWDPLLGGDATSFVGPITGRDFLSWSDRLRDVEEMVDEAGLRNEIAVARERARVFRQEYKRDLKKPDWAVVRLQVMKPLVDVRDRIAEELARRESREALVPIDRDPVPARYSELVRRYYEELGKDK